MSIESSHHKLSRTKKKSTPPAKTPKTNQKTYDFVLPRPNRFLSKPIGFESTQSSTIGLGSYKKVFVEQLETRRHDSNFVLNREFNANHAITTDSSQHYQKHIEKKLFSQFLKDKEEHDKIRALDQTREIFHSLAQHLVENPLAFDKFDASKVT